MKANRAYELSVRRAGRAPAILAPADAADVVEVVEVESGEVVLLWDTHPAQTRRLARALRTDLAQLEARAFLAKWRRFQG